MLQICAHWKWCMIFGNGLTFASLILKWMIISCDCFNDESLNTGNYQCSIFGFMLKLYLWYSNECLYYVWLFWWWKFELCEHQWSMFGLVLNLHLWYSIECITLYLIVLMIHLWRQCQAWVHALRAVHGAEKLWAFMWFICLIWTWQSKIALGFKAHSL